MTTTPLKTRPVPRRTCIGCNTTTNKRELVRVVRQPEGGVVADPTGKKAGRGAYVHQQPECWELALKKGRSSVRCDKLSADDLRGLRGTQRQRVSA